MTQNTVEISRLCYEQTEVGLKPSSEEKYGIFLRCADLVVLPDSVHCSFPAKSAEICSYVSCCLLCQLHHVDAGTNRHSGTENRQDGLSLLYSGRPNDHLKETGSIQYRIHL